MIDAQYSARPEAPSPSEEVIAVYMPTLSILPKNNAFSLSQKLLIQRGDVLAFVSWYGNDGFHSSRGPLPLALP